MIHKISVLVLVVVSVACVKVQKKGGDAGQPEVRPPAQQSAPGKGLSKGFDFDYDLSQPTDKVVFSFPAQWQNVVVEKVVKNLKIYQKEIVQTDRHWSDFLDQEKVTYKFYQGKDQVLVKEVEVIPALDLQVVSDLNLAEVYSLNDKVKKLYFKNLSVLNGSKIFIGNFTGEIFIDHLDSDDGVLQTFAENSRNLTGDGRSVGGFDLKIKDGSGRLKINLVAESGLHGIEAPGPDEKIKGADGIQGRPAAFTVIPPTQVFDGFPSFIVGYNCTSEPGPGENAHDGKQGYRGHDGNNGGNVLKIKVTNESPLLAIETISQAGYKGYGSKGGAGGRPGQPGAGGDGGMNDMIKFLKIPADRPVSGNRVENSILGYACPAAKSGNVGIDGSAGENGIDGHDGQVF